ncbi:hypothetical protein Tco_0241208 [Tanacetum coccineum]
MAEQDIPPPTITAMKIPIIRKGEYDIWSMRMRQYICHTDHNLWDVIVNGDLEEEPAPTTGETSAPPAPKTAKQLAARRNQERVKSILLLAIPDEYLLKFHNVADAKSLWEAIKSRFGGNVESKKMQKNVLKHQFENFSTASNESLDKAYDRFQKLISQLEVHGAPISKEDINQKFLRSLPSSWNQIALIMRNKPDIDEIDIDDLYNNLRVYEDELKRGYEIALESLESRILGHEKNELAWGEKYEFQNYELKCRGIKINNLNLELEKVVKKRDELKDKIAKWEESSKNLDEILNSQMSARDKTGLGYSTQLNELSSNHETDSENSFSVFDGRSSDEESILANDRSSKADGYKFVPPLITGNFLTPRADISFGKLVPNLKINRDSVIIEDWNSDDEEEGYEVQKVRPETQIVKTRDDKSGQTSQKQGIGVLTRTGCSLVNFQGHVCTARPSISTVRPICTARLSISTARPVYASRPIYPRMDNVRPRGSCSHIKRSYYTKPAFRPKDLKQDVKTFGVKNMTTAGKRVVVDTGKGKLDTDLKKSKWVWRPKENYLDHVSKVSGSFMLKKGNLEILLQDHTVVDSGCSSHMTGNKANLSDYEDFNGGFVAFGSDPKRGTQDSYVTGLSGKDKGPTQEYILLLLQPHKTRIPLNDVVQIAQEKLLKSSPDKDIQILKMFFEKEGQHQMPEDEQHLKKKRGKLHLKKKADQATNTNTLSTDRPFVSTDRPFVSTDSVYLGGKIPNDASTLPNADLPIDPNMPDLEDASDTLPNDGIFNRAYDDDEDVGAVADFNNMDNTIAVSPIPTLRILGDPTSAVQTRGKIQKASSAQQALIVKWEESSKNLDEILNSQMSARDKTGLGYSTQLNELSSNHETDSENSFSVFDGRSSDEESTLANDRSSKADGYKFVPPLITGNFLTPRADISFAGLDEYAIRKKIIESQTTELNTKTSETAGQTNAEKPKSASESVVSNPKIDRDRVIIEDWNSNDKEEEYEVQTVRLETQTVKTRDDKSDCNFHDKKSQEPKLKNVVHTGQREGKPVWDNTKRINHQNFSKYPHLSKTFVPSGVLTRTGLHRPSVSTARPVCTARPSISTARPSISTARPVCTARPSISTARSVYASRPIYPRMDNVRQRGSCSPIKRSYYTKPAFKPKDLKQDVKIFRVQNMSTAGTRAVVNTGKGKLDTDFKKSRWVWRPKGNYLDHVSKDSGSFMLKKGNPEILLQDHAVVDSGCSSHMSLISMDWRMDRSCAANSTHIWSYSDKHNMVAFLKKPNESVGFTEVVDFLKGTSLRYALTHNPTIYDSLVKQFWQTVTVRTLANGTQQLVASIDSKEYTITEASVRSKLQLADATRIHNLSDAKIYAGLATLRYVTEGAAMDQGEGSAQPAEPHPTPVDPLPSTSLPPNQSPPHSPHQSPPHSPFQSPPYSPPHSSPPRSYEAPFLEGNTSGSVKASIQLKELMILVPSLVTRVTSLEKELKDTKQTLGNVVLKLVKKVKSLEKALKRKSKKVIVSASEGEEPEDQGRIIQDIDDDPLVSLVRESMKEKSTDFVTPTKALGKAQEEEEISPTILEAAKTLSKVASQSVSKAKSTDKDKRYKRRARSMAKKINTELDDEDEINTGRVEINSSIKDVNTGSSKVDTGRTSISTSSIIHSPKKGQRERKAQMVEEDIQATYKTKEQIRKEEAGLEEAIKLQA